MNDKEVYLGMTYLTIVIVLAQIAMIVIAGYVI